MTFETDGLKGIRFRGVETECGFNTRGQPDVFNLHRPTRMRLLEVVWFSDHTVEAQWAQTNTYGFKLKAPSSFFSQSNFDENRLVVVLSKPGSSLHLRALQHTQVHTGTLYIHSKSACTSAPPCPTTPPVRLRPATLPATAACRRRRRRLMRMMMMRRRSPAAKAIYCIRFIFPKFWMIIMVNLTKFTTFDDALALPAARTRPTR